MGPLMHVAWVCAAVIAGCWLLSIITREYSWTDRVWSIAPIYYSGYIAYYEGWQNPRLNLMAALVAAWGIRLTLNFARRGGYWKGGEDYRWEILKEKLGPVKFQLFNATFIAPYQNFLVCLITLPCYGAWLFRETPLQTLDWIAAAVFAALLIYETVADQQQWNFQQIKHAIKARGETPKEQFRTTGLFSLSRHPAYFAELGQWWVLYVFVIAASGKLFHWTLVGVVLLQMLFEGSVRFSEGISLKRYPEYADYQKSTSRLFPWFPAKSDSKSTDKTAKSWQ